MHQERVGTGSFSRHCCRSCEPKAWQAAKQFPRLPVDSQQAAAVGWAKPTTRQQVSCRFISCPLSPARERARERGILMVSPSPYPSPVEGEGI
ncbi:MAG: hypothetical protein FJ022_02330 [Chloroflexi bacterium]|nr:hypothetical protein [Chloroflexota bacterium]